jgi:hypothetical protein
MMNMNAVPFDKNAMDALEAALAPRILNGLWINVAGDGDRPAMQITLKERAPGEYEAVVELGTFGFPPIGTFRASTRTATPLRQRITGEKRRQIWERVRAKREAEEAARNRLPAEASLEVGAV